MRGLFRSVLRMGCAENPRDRGWHDFVDVAVLRPGASFSMLRMAPEGLDLRTERNVGRQCFDLLVHLRASRQVPMPHSQLVFDQRDCGKPDCEPEIPKSQATRCGIAKVITLSVARKTSRCCSEQGVQQVRPRECSEGHQLRNA